MSFNAIQILLVAVWSFIVAIDQFDLLESLYQPIVTGAVIGAILGDLQTGLIVGGTYQLMTIGNMPVGGAQPPNAVIGGIMATVFAISSGLDTSAAVGLAVPFALIGQYMVTLLFTVMSPLMSTADKMAEKADAKGIVRLNYLAMGALGLLFAIVCVAGLLGGSALGETLTAISEKYAWIMTGLSTAGGMICYSASYHAFQRPVGNLFRRFHTCYYHWLHPGSERFCSASGSFCWYRNCTVRLPDSRCY